jgi:polyhydroxyalkanoate synthase
MSPFRASELVSLAITEMDHNARRVSNGLRYVTGYEWSPPYPTPHRTIWTSGNARVRRYQSTHPRRFRQPVLAFAGLVSRPYCFDLAPSSSFVSRLMEAGFDAYVLDWGVPGVSQSAFTLETYLSDLLPSAIDAVVAESGADSLTMLGYCMGGNMAVQALAAQPSLPVRNLALMTVGVDLTLLGPLFDSLRQGRVDPKQMLDATGNLPPRIVEGAFRYRRPTDDVVQLANLVTHLWDDEYMAGYQAMGRWIREHVPIAGAAFLQIVDQWVHENAFLTDRLRLGGKPVSLGRITVPTMAALGLRDDMIPPESSRPIAQVLTGTAVDMIEVPTGHAGMTAGRTGARVTTPRVIEWLSDHTQALPTPILQEL